jgi:hypothetical protein
MKTKERLRNQPTRAPPYPRSGIPGLPSSDEEGRGVVRLCDLGVKPRLRYRKMREQSENVYENKRGVEESKRRTEDPTHSLRRSPEHSGWLLDFSTLRLQFGITASMIHS